MNFGFHGSAMCCTRVNEINFVTYLLASLLALPQVYLDES